MIDNNKDLFEELKINKKGTPAFNEAQRKALRIVRRNEDLLCSKTESAHFANFSTGLADKFWEELRAAYPEIDYAEEI